MQSVDPKFYKYFNIFSVVLGLVLLLSTIVLWATNMIELRYSFGLSPITAVFGLFQVVYGLLFYNRHAKSNPLTAGVMTSVFLSLNVINLIHTTGQLSSFYMGLWLLLVFYCGAFGMYSPISFNFFITVYFLLLQTDASALLNGKFEIYDVIIVLVSYVVGGVSYFFWRNFYLDNESERVKNLSGQLKSSQKEAEILVRSISDGVIVINKEGLVQLFNPAAEKLTGWKISEATGIDIKLILKIRQENGKDFNETNYPLGKLIAESSPTDINLQLIKKDNSSTLVSLVSTPVVDEKGKPIGGSAIIIRDITSAKEEENRRAEFISTASHEMRTPVAAIEGYLQLALNDQVSKIDSKAREFLNKALDSTHHLGKLFQDLLTSAKAEDGRIVSHPQPIEMSSYVKDLTDGLRFAADKKGLLLEFKLGASADAQANKTIAPLYYVNADPDRLREVITNLFDNAVKYTEEGKIVVALTGNNEVVQLFIKDTGHGIPKEDIPHLFQKFYRVDNSATRTIGGTGLGLFICKKIIDMFNGRIWVDSEPGQGSTFYINLPRISAQKAAELQQQSGVTPQQ